MDGGLDTGLGGLERMRDEGGLDGYSSSTKLEFRRLWGCGLSDAAKLRNKVAPAATCTLAIFRDWLRIRRF